MTWLVKIYVSAKENVKIGEKTTMFSNYLTDVIIKF